MAKITIAKPTNYDPTQPTVVQFGAIAPNFRALGTTGKNHVDWLANVIGSVAVNEDDLVTRIAGKAGLTGGNNFTTGVQTISDATQSTAVGNGALVVAGGGSFAKNISTAGKIVISNTDSNSLYDTNISAELTNIQGAIGGKGSAIKFRNDYRGYNMNAIIASGLESSSATGSTGYLSFGTKAAETDVLPTERLKILSNGVIELKKGQLKFPATQNLSDDPDTLDDYKERTWVPTVTSSSGIITSYTASGTYTKVGNTIFFQIRILLTNAGTAAGYLKATLPVNSNSIKCVATGIERNSGYVLSIDLPASNNYITFLKYDGTFRGSTGDEFIINGFYFV